MRNTAIGLLFIFLIVSKSLFSEEYLPIERLDIQNVVERVLEGDVSVSISNERTKMAFGSYRSSIAETLPQLDFSSNYSLTSQPSLPDSEPGGNGDASHSIYSGFSLSRALPTSGNLELQIENTMDISTDEGGRTNFSQNPHAVFSLQQPIFFNGKVIDTKLYSASLRKSEIAYLKALEEEKYSRNEAVYNALDLFLKVIGLRKEVSLEKRQIENNVKRLEKNAKSYNMGLISESELLDMKDALTNQKELLLDTNNSLRIAEFSLGQLLKLERIEHVEFDESLAFTDLKYNKDKAIEIAVGQNPLLLAERLSLEESKIDNTFKGIDNASSLSLSFSLSPGYPENRSGYDLAASFTDYFSKEADIDYTFSADLNVPLYHGGKKKRDREVSISSERIAHLKLLRQTELLIQNLSSLFFRMNALEKKLEILKKSIYEGERMLEIRERQFMLGKTTESDLQNSMFNLETRHNKLWKLNAERLLIILDIYAVVGETLSDVLLKNP